MTSPSCTINALTPPQDVAASSTVTLALANASGVVFWGLTCIGTDETTTAAAVNATLAVNSSAKTATFTAGGLGTATIWQSTVGVGSKSQQGAGCDANNAVQPSYTTTFKVNVKASNGNRVLVVNEVYEQDSTFGWINEVNAALRGEQTSTITLLGDVTGNTSASVVSGISGVSPIAITPSTLQWALGTSAPTITQSTQVSNAAPNNLTIAPQAPNAGAGNTANGTPGSFTVNVASPTSTGAHAGLSFQEAGSQYFFTQRYSGLSTRGGLWLGTTAPSASNVMLDGDGTSLAIFNVPSGGTGYFRIAEAAGLGIYTSNGFQLFSESAAFGGGTGVLGVANRSVVPSTNPTGGGILYAEAGAGKWRGSSGTVTTFGPAEPHCDVCGSDFVTEHESDVYGYLSVCLKCMADELGARPWIRRTKKVA